MLLALYVLTDLILNYYTNSINKNWSLYIWSVFTFAEYLIFTYILWLKIKKKIFRKIILWLSFLFIIFATVFNIATNFAKIDSIPIGIETILIFIYSFYYLYEQMNDTSNLFIYNKYEFWIIIGFLIYLAGSFFIFIAASKMENEILRNYWYLTNGFYVIMNLMFIIAFYMKATSKIKRSKPNTLPSLWLP